MFFRQRAKDAERIHQLEKRVAVEVPKKKKQTEKTIAQTNKIANNFTRVVKENHFTMRIHVATTGK